MFVLALLSSITFYAFSLDKNYKLNNDADLLMDKLRMARERTWASENDSRYGIYFDVSADPDRYIIFKGNDFASRDPSFDEVCYLSKSVEISSVNLNGGNEVSFEKVTGAPNVQGNISLKLISSPDSKTIYINSLGQVSFDPAPAASDDDRIQDARHIHFKYTRVVDTAETISLNFDGGAQIQAFAVSGALVGGNIYWEEKVIVGGQTQEVSIRTINGLNNPAMEFCIHRDGRLNDKSLAVSISGDSSGDLAEFSADGLNSFPESIYVEDFEWK